MTLLKNTLEYKLELVKDGLWRLSFHFPSTSTNCWLVQDASGLTLVDCANRWNAGTICDVINELGQSLTDIIITHAHPDHAGAAGEIARRFNATIWAHEADIPFLQDKNNLSNEPASLQSHLLHKIAHRLGLLNPPSIEAVEPLKDFGEVGSLTVVHTPGHTPGSLSVYSEPAKALFIGDNATFRLGKLRVNNSWFTLDTANLKSSIRKYKEFPTQLLLTGHGPVYQSEDAVADLIKLVR